MKHSQIIVLLGICATLPWLSCRSSRSLHNDINAYIDRYENKAAYLNRQVNLARWEYYTEVKSDSLEYFFVQKKKSDFTIARLSQIKKFQASLGNTKERQQLENMYAECLRAALDNTPEIQRLLTFLNGAALEFQPVFEGRRCPTDSLRAIVAQDGVGERRRDAYLASVAVGGVLADGVVSLARLRNQTAISGGYANYHDAILAANGLSRSEFLDLLGRLDKLSAEPYRKALDSFKSANSLGDVQAWDMPYIFHKVNEQFSSFSRTDEQMRLLDATMSGMGYKLKAMSIYFDSVMSASQEMPPDYLAMHIPGDVRLLIRREDGWTSLERLFGLTGRALYAAQIDQRDYLLARPAAPCLEYAAAAFFSGLVGSDGWLRKYAALPDPLVQEMTSMQYLYRLYAIRGKLLEASFEYEMYQNPAADLNQLYRELCQKYLFFTPSPETYPWASDLDYIVSPGAKANRVFGDCIAAQFYQYLTKKYGSVLDNQRTRDFLSQNIFRPGARDDWHDLISRATGEKLRPEYYFVTSGN